MDNKNSQAQSQEDPINRKVRAYAAFSPAYSGRLRICCSPSSIDQYFFDLERLKRKNPLRTVNLFPGGDCQEAGVARR
jgi:hypothetical protein